MQRIPLLRTQSNRGEHLGIEQKWMPGRPQNYRDTTRSKTLSSIYSTIVCTPGGVRLNRHDAGV
jgi:hypothetical protein